MPNLACLRRLDIEAARSSRRRSSSASPEPAIARRTGARLTLGRERLRALPSPRPGDLHVRTGAAGTRSRRAQHARAGPRLRSLCLGEVCRKRYPLRTILAARRLPRRDRIRRPPGTACGGELVLQPEALHRTHTFHTILADLPPETLPCRRPGSRHDGKDIRGASNRERPAGRSGRARMVLGQVEVDAKSNEIPLASSINVASRIVTMDAMHAQHERRLLERRMSSRRSRITRKPCSTTSRPSTSRARSKPSTRAHRARDLQDQREQCRDHLVPHLARPRTPRDASGARVMENRLHYVRDFTCDEDRCRVRRATS